MQIADLRKGVCYQKCHDPHRLQMSFAFLRCNRSPHMPMHTLSRTYTHAHVAQTLLEHTRSCIPHACACAHGCACAGAYIHIHIYLCINIQIHHHAHACSHSPLLYLREAHKRQREINKRVSIGFKRATLHKHVRVHVTHFTLISGGLI